MQHVQDDNNRLRELGYKQELDRTMSGFSNFALSFTIISVLAGTMTLFGFGLNVAGPSAMGYGWPIVCVFQLIVAASMAEIVSSYPTAGGLYYWSAKLGGPGWGWFTAWFNVIGQIAVTAGIDYGLAMFVDALLNQFIPVVPVKGFGGSVTTLVIFAVILVVQAWVNSLGINFVSLLNTVSAWWHIAGVLIIAIALFFFAGHHENPLAFVFSTRFTNSGFPFFYAFPLGFLLTAYTVTGFDASAHVSEETKGAAYSAARAMVSAVLVSAVAGYILLLGLAIAIPDLKETLNASNAVLFILNTRFGSAVGTVMFLISLVAQFFCGTASITSNSRMLFAFARDGGLPASKFIYCLNKKRVPLNALIVSITGAFILALPALFSTVVYSAVTSIAVIGLTIAYAIPIFLKNIKIKGKEFEIGPWNLGKWSSLIGWIAVVWSLFLSILFILPVQYPITPVNFNFTGVVFIIVWLVLIPWYFLSVRKWFKGPKSAFEDLKDIDISA